MLPTADGVEVGLEGTIYLTLETTNADTLKQFDNRFGTRTFQGVDGKAYFIWDEGHGVNAFLNQIVRPIISTALRQEIGHANCAELQASCNLILQAAAAANVDPTKTPLNSGTKITDIQNAVNAVLTNDLRDTLGGSYFVNVRFTLSKVTLPKEAQAAINSAQAAFAKVTEAKARVQAAIQDGLANEKRQLGYSKCPTCAQIDMLKALPTGITTYAPGSGIALAVPTNK
jgi:regulator of protease activity HflC (stomatin/prohibitin superfamily)